MKTLKKATQDARHRYMLAYDITLGGKHLGAPFQDKNNPEERVTRVLCCAQIAEVNPP